MRVGSFIQTGVVEHHIFFESLSSLTSMPFLFLVRVRVCCVLLAVAQYECVVLMIERLKIVSITAGSCVASKSDS